MPQPTSVNYLKLLWVLQEDDNIGTGEEWEAGDIGTAGRKQLLPMLRVCGTPGNVHLQPSWLWGQDSPLKNSWHGTATLELERRYDQHRR